MKDKLDASCRLAFAAYLHDLGKLAERARIEEGAEKDQSGNTRSDLNKHLYCPQWNGRHTHVHAAYTAIAIDLVEDRLPGLVGEDVSPFAAWKAGDVDDSLINAAAMHHKPDTALQWIIATADRLASGFEREEFDNYNRSADETATGKNHYTARQYTLFEQIRFEGGDACRKEEELDWRYALKPQSVDALFPRHRRECEGNNTREAQGEYRALWRGFEEALASIPEAHRRNWPLWFDHFDSLWACYAHAVPSATAGKTKPEVSLYDHSRTTAALATALWRYHESDDPAVLREDLRAQWDRQRQHQDAAEKAWSEDKYLLIMGDLFGIQDFIFATGGETQRNVAKLLRGRSFYISLLIECAALRVLEELGLPPTSQVINAAGKFLIVAPNTKAVIETLERLQEELDNWFLGYTYGTSGVGISWEPASGRDFLHGGAAGLPPFRTLIDRLFNKMEDAKAHRFSLAGSSAPAAVFDGFLDGFDSGKGVCAIDGRSPATAPLPGTEGRFVGSLALDQVQVGKWLSHNDRMLVSTRPINHNTLGLDIFGYYVSFTDNEAASGQFGNLASEGVLRRAWDYSLPCEKEAPLFNGYSRRAINAYVPLMGDQNAWEGDRYKGIDNQDKGDSFAPKTFEHIARDDLWLNESGGWCGTEALVTLKGDVDNLGSIFQNGLERPSFAKWASLSRQVHAFFSVYLPWLCHRKYPSTYTVFAGGDDFFLIGPWKSTVLLARELRADFRAFVADNPGIHFSGGLLMTKPGIPIRQMGGMSEHALESAKAMPGKDAVTIFGQTLRWKDFDVLWKTLEQIETQHAQFALSTGYLYQLQDLAHMSENLKSDRPEPENTMWRSRFAYRTWRMLERQLGGTSRQHERKRRMEELAQVLSEPIDRYGDRFIIPLFIHLYNQRS